MLLGSSVPLSAVLVLADGAQIIYGVITFFGSTSAGAIVTAVFQNKKIKAEAKSLDAKTKPEVENLSVTTMAEVIDNLREDNQCLRQERDNLKAQLLEMQRQVDSMREQLDGMRIRLAEALDRVNSTSDG